MMEPATITLNGNVLHHASQKDGGEHFCADASHTNYLIIQSYGSLGSAQMEELEQRHVDVQQYFSGDTFICRYEPSDLSELRSLPFLHFVNPYHPDYVVINELK